jgi:pimeloyl-ACP methyl ester carboxylesterase
MPSWTTGERHFDRVLGTELHWLESGAGRPLVLLHGLADCHRTWRRLAAELAPGRRVLMLDLAGHGLSERPDASYTLDWHAALVGAWIDRLGLEEFDLVGHSYGGGVAQWLVLSHAARIRRLGLVAPGGLGRSVGLSVRLSTLGLVERLGQPFMGVGTRLGMRAAGMSDPSDIANASWMNSAPGSARALRRTAAGVVDWSGQRVGMLDHVDRVATLPPIALFWGDRDPVIPFRQAEDMRARLTGIPLVRFGGVGHFPHHERPRELGRALGDFLDEACLERPTIVRPLMVSGGLRRPSAVRRFFGAIGASVRRWFTASERLAA